MAAIRKHGMFGTKIYGSWSSMVQRCTDINHPYYKNYGGKGITVCDKWRTFEGFYEDMKENHQDNLMIDRIKNEEGYSKDNCRWSTRLEQANNMTTNRIVEVDGEKMTLAQACRFIGIKNSVVNSRLHRGWSLYESLHTPVSRTRESNGRYTRCKLNA